MAKRCRRVTGIPPDDIEWLAVRRKTSHGETRELECVRRSRAECQGPGHIRKPD
jgi:hypothetical protein